MFRVVPQLTVADLPRSMAFYADILGFAVTVEDPPGAPDFVSLEREDATLFLVSDASREDPQLAEEVARGRRGAGVRLYLEVDDAEAWYARLRETGVEIVRELTYNESEDYRVFQLLDPDGYRIGVYS